MGIHMYLTIPDPFESGYNLIVRLKELKIPNQSFQLLKVEAYQLVRQAFAGVVVTQLAKSDDLKAIVMLHPSFVTVDDIKEIKVPFAILGAEIDHMSPSELLKQFDEAAKPEVDHFVKIFPGTSHGWSVRYKVEDEAAVKRAEEAHQDLLDWFIKYVK